MPKRTETKYIVVHCSATKPTLDIGRDVIKKWHTDKGWADIGYSLVIRRNGLCEMGRHPDDIGAHVAGFNSTSVGICLVGGLYIDGKEAEDDFAGLFTKEQESALRYALYFYKSLYPSAKIVGHRDMSPDTDKDGVVEKHEWLKSCPGFSVQNWVKENGL